MYLIKKLFDGPIDIVGDVHGEIDALKTLLHQLGYDKAGNHPQHRRLVFLGDLVDRGPDSIGVVQLVMKLMENGKAQCVLGNHELNIIVNKPMHGNGWIIQPNEKDPLENNPDYAANQAIAPTLINFLKQLPLALENDDLRITHACWNQAAIDTLKKQNHTPVVEVYNAYHEQYENLLASPEMTATHQALLTHGEALKNPDIKPPLLPPIGKKEYAKQMTNPIRILTTSSMCMAKTPYFGGGKWRMAERDPWWDNYDGDKPVVIGHFWRQFDPKLQRISGVFGKDLFENIPPHAWMGKNKNVYCVDYSVGQRQQERKNEKGKASFYGKLAALRMPERTVMHDDGSVIATY